ncbi:ATP-binding cassette domain-containing protein [Streptacidiphilus monticola]|uniref:ATP-binding cassette domain-containing protein n=1 Tax=Streptacidiphilus monticola TaxID=2161674 RepID=A0ABW1FZT5_9ACTN
MKGQPRRAPLVAEGVVRRFGGVVAVAGVSLSVPPGAVTGLVGANGAGKSTLFDCLSGAATPDAGRVLLSGRDVTTLPAHRRARLGLLRGFQQIAVFPGLTVGDNIRLGAEQAGRRRVADPVAATDQALRTLGLTHLRDHPATDLPTGTLRLVELGRALAAAPAVLLLDEPAAGLDRAETERLTALLRHLADDGLALLLVEHDRDLVDRIADRVCLMTNGQLLTPAAPVAAHGA